MSVVESAIRVPITPVINLEFKCAWKLIQCLEKETDLLGIHQNTPSTTSEPTGEGQTILVVGFIMSVSAHKSILVTHGDRVCASNSGSIPQLEG